MLSSLRRFWKLVALLGLVGALVALGASQPFTRSYTATATLAIPADVSQALLPASGSPAPTEAYTANQVTLLESPAVAARAAVAVDRLEHTKVLGTEDVLANVEVAPATSAGPTGSPGGAPPAASATDSLRAVNFTWASRRVAAETANAVVTAYGQVRADSLRSQAGATTAGIDSSVSRVDAELAFVVYAVGLLEGQDQAAQDRPSAASSSRGTAAPPAPTGATVQGLLLEEGSLNNRKDQLLSRLDQVQVSEATLISPQVTSVPAAPPAAAANGQVVLWVLVGLASGILVGAFLAYVLARRRRRFEHRFEPEALYGAPLLGDVPAFNRDQLASKLPISTDPTSAAAESFRFVASSLKVLAVTDGPVTLSFVSASSGAGKTVVSANVALALAQTGCRVLAVDADFLRQDLTRTLLGRVPERGLVEVMEGRMSLDDATWAVVSTESGSLEVLPGGLEGFLVPGISRRHLGAFVVRAKVDHDVVVVDGPPLLEAAYATDLLAALDAAVTLVNHHEAVRDHPSMVERLELVDADVCGYVYNRAPLREQRTSYYQGYRPASGAGARGDLDDSAPSSRPPPPAAVPGVEPAGAARQAAASATSASPSESVRRGPDRAASPGRT